jgi:uncharacterized protein YqjF (DUF2071 family)
MDLRRGEGGRIEYESERLWPGPAPAECRLSYEPAPDETARPSAPGTLEFVLAERYVLYAHSRGVLYRGRVHHAPYPLRPARLVSLDDSLVSTAGIRPAEPSSEPLSHYAAGVDVKVYGLCRVGTAH